MTTKHILLSLLGLSLFFSCQEDTEDIVPNLPDHTKNSVTKAVFSGYAQKGPFINGSSVTILELDENLDQTGKTYFTTISDNLGRFENKNIELISNYASLKADGYYFNEVSGETSSGQITLYALVDVVDVNSANVNVLTHLERSRVEYLVQHDSLIFAEAKKQAQKEVMDIFGFSIKEPSTFESLDLTNNAVLLAISCILQGLLSTGEMAEFMADIITDIRPDGVLDNQDLKTKLIDNAILVPLSSVRDNMTSKYTELGMNVSVPDFESYVESFIGDKTTPSVSVSYPEKGLYGGINILSDEVTSIAKINKNGAPVYSMSADVPRGLSLKVIIKSGPDMDAGAWAIEVMPNQPVNWRIGQYDWENRCQEFTILEYEKQNDLKIQFATRNYTGNPQYIMIEYYENGSETPVKVKKVYLEEPDDIDNTEFCKYLNMENLNRTIPIINDFLSICPDDASMEQIYGYLVTWLNSFSCDLNARILYGEDMIWGHTAMRGVAFSIMDNSMEREIELDFVVTDNMQKHVQIAGFIYYKQDAVNVKTKYTDVNKVFDFINSLELDVQEIQNGTYLSSMVVGEEILQSIINNLKAKPYTRDSWVTGHLGWYDASFVIFLNLYDMKNRDYQTDWIQTMNEYSFENYVDEHTIVFQIPEETGKQWEATFTGYDFVEWANLSYTRYTIR